MKLDSILMPVFKAEIPQLLTWLNYCPLPGIQKIELYISIDTYWDDYDKYLIINCLEHSLLGRVINHINFISCGLDTKESFYLRVPNESFDKNTFPYGYKSGPNKQFFVSLKKLTLEYNPSAVILLEVDAFPLKDYWFDNITYDLNKISDKFLIAGAKYQGESYLSDKIKDHLNGNSVYFTGHDRFLSFLSAWEKLLIDSIKIAPHMAYDCVIPWYENWKNHHIGVKGLECDGYNNLSFLYNNYSYDLSHLLINLGGDNENSTEYDLNIYKFKSNYPLACIVHGKCFIKIIHILRQLMRYSDEIDIYHPLNIAYEGISNKNIDISLCSNNLSPEIVGTLIKNIKYLSYSPRYHNPCS